MCPVNVIKISPEVASCDKSCDPCIKPYALLTSKVEGLHAERKMDSNSSHLLKCLTFNAF